MFDLNWKQTWSHDISFIISSVPQILFIIFFLFVKCTDIKGTSQFLN